MVGKIYIIKNNVNNKVYIGATVQSLRVRFLQHCKKTAAIQQKCVFHTEIQKIGKTHFWIELLEDNVPKEKLFEREIFFIKKFNSFYNGYNQTKGGNEGFLNTQVAVNLIVNEYKKGKTINQLSSFFEVSDITIFRLLQKEKVLLRKDGSKLFLFPKEDFISLWNNQKITIPEIATKLNVHERTVKRHALRLKLKPRHSWSTKKKSVGYRLRKNEEKK